MGFRPIALTNNLFFGDPALSDDPKRVLDGVIKGLTHYGNCVGVPTVSSKILFHKCYEKNPLVNAMAVGHSRGPTLRCGAKDPGKLLYVGAKTGRDGIGGAVMASDSFTNGVDLRPTVQVGDPYLEKLLIEACLELAETGHVIAAQDMGAAGLTSSVTEIGIKGGSATFTGKCGIELDLDKIPLRETGMEAWEILLSESQERMLFVIHDWGIEEAKAIFNKWDLDCVEIGHLTGDGNFVVYKDNKVCCNFPLSALEYPEFERPWKPVGTRAEIVYEYPYSTENMLSQYDSEVQSIQKCLVELKRLNEGKVDSTRRGTSPTTVIETPTESTNESTTTTPSRPYEDEENHQIESDKKLDESVHSAAPSRAAIHRAVTRSSRAKGSSLKKISSEGRKHRM